jgi:hypothetical protein
MVERDRSVIEGTESQMVLSPVLSWRVERFAKRARRPTESAIAVRVPERGELSSHGRHNLAVALTAAEGAWLRAIIDRLARERLGHDGPHCAGCRCLAFERTAGCALCRYRHAARRRQFRRLFAELRLPSDGRSRSARARWRSPV